MENSLFFTIIRTAFRAPGEILPALFVFNTVIPKMQWK